jgi:ubiquinone/menaquinone biosynthesis C-methylase UbiE
MDPKEYQSLFRIEKNHWFYKGKRDIVRHWINQLRPLKSSDILLDVGMGTGLLLSELEDTCRTYGLDYYNGAFQYAATRAPGRLLQGTLTQLPLQDHSVSIVSALDVLEHIEDDRRALNEMIRVTMPGGLIIINVPAFMILWSDWDKKLHHFRRYKKKKC